MAISLYGISTNGIIITYLCVHIATNWGGRGIKGECFIGSHVLLDGIYPNLIEIGYGCIITSGITVHSHFIALKKEDFMRVKSGLVIMYLLG